MNNGNGDTEGGGGSFGPGFSGMASGGLGSGYGPAGESISGGGLSPDKFDILGPLSEPAISSPPPEPSAPPEPSTLDDLTNAFSPQYAPPETFPTEPSKAPDTVAERAVIDVCRELAFEGATLVGGLIDILLGAVFAFVQGAQIAGFAVRSGEKLAETTIGKQVRDWLLMDGKPSTQRQATPSPSVSAPALARGAPITLSPDGYKGSKSEGNLESVLSFTPTQKAPSSYPSYYGGSAYPALSMSLFQAKESAGLMIFPTSGGAIEPEMSSLMKKEQSIIDTPSLLFLMGMGLLGVVLRGKR